MNCRYCFRRHFPYSDNSPGRTGWHNSLDYVRNRSDIEEVILSGGDPLIAPDRHLRWIIEQLETIEHVKRLRIHTRVPVVIPSRITEELVACCSSSRLQTSIVLHCNHAAEVSKSLSIGLNLLRERNITLLNQSVLLAGINDDSRTLCQLSEALFDVGVLPYYLHMPDRVAGTAHFSVTEEHATALYRDMLAVLPGYLVPRLVVETPGSKSKTGVVIVESGE